MRGPDRGADRRRRPGQATRRGCARAAMASTAGASHTPRCTACRGSAASTPRTSRRRCTSTRTGSAAIPSMRAIAATLSDQDMADLAAYYSQAFHEDGGQMMNTTRISALLAAVTLLACTPALAADMAAGAGEGQGSLPGLPRPRRQQPVSGLSASRWTASPTTSPRRCATTSRALARTRSWTGSRRRSPTRTSTTSPPTSRRSRRSVHTKR